MTGMVSLLTFRARVLDPYMGCRLDRCRKS
jgi:hypothetical protein